MIKAEYISPHEGSSWHQNDFVPGENYVTNDRVFTCVTSGINEFGEVELNIEWISDGYRSVVWPNSQYIALNWEED